MAKSLRSKVKRDFRSKKREVGVYAATEAARLHRLNAKLKAVISKDTEQIPSIGEEGEGIEDLPDSNFINAHNNDAVAEPSQQQQQDSMQVDGPSELKSVSTHGPRRSRREEWRTSKGLPARPTSFGMNRQGGLAARRKAGRSKRRR